MHHPQVPETLEGWSLLHHMYRVRWEAVRGLSPHARGEVTTDLGAWLETRAKEPGACALVQLLGHKGDLMLIDFRPSFEELAATELALAQTRLSDYLTLSSSYVSMVELGMYEMTAKIHQQLGSRGLSPGSDVFEQAFDEEMQIQRQRVMSRLFVEVPKRRHVCFYPMNKRRGEVKNWYAEPVEARARMMLDHGKIGRHYAGEVSQIISGAIGFDDWEWGVDLFADDPVVFKKLIYEMRFDEASAWYAEFGPFYVGLQFSPSELPKYLEGEVPVLRP